MQDPITPEIVEAYAQCPRKAFLLLRGGQEAVPHEYERIIDEQEAANREGYRARQAAEAGGVPAHGPDDLAGQKILFDVPFAVDGLQARCDALRRVRADSASGGFAYEPVKVVGTGRVGRAQAVGLAYLGHVLGLVQRQLPAAGTLVLAGGRSCRVKLAARYKEVRSIIAALTAWAEEPTPKPPPVVLNRHCPCCPFRAGCRRQAEEEDSLTLLDRMTPKLLRQYQAKGIFTVHQLSHTFRPRRSRKKGRRTVWHSLELQALALRTGKTYVEHLPDLARRPVELFVDVEGVPERNAFYLIGLLACAGDDVQYHAFWADGPGDEARMWEGFLARVTSFPDAPIYHYGSYERKAFRTLARRHGRGKELLDRLVNVASSVYGRVYFPVRCNGLKVLGRFLGAAWTSPEASGLMSLVWRHRWETTGDDPHKAALLQYNWEDCEAVRVLVARLVQIKETAASEPGVDFAHRPKQAATESGKEVHRQFERILRNAQEDGRRRSVRIRAGDTEAEAEPRKRGARPGHQTYRRIIPSKVGRTVRVACKRRCPRGHGDLRFDEQARAERTVIDLVFTRSGCRKAVTRYAGKRGWCAKCNRYYEPPALQRLGNFTFGHAFQAWTIYQRVVLRLPYRILLQVTAHLFGVGFSQGTVTNFLRYLADYYAATEAALLQAIRKSPFVHVDETRINIEGVDHYAWVFTDGRHVVFRMTESREADVVREVLAGYEGVLVSDFYPGYDGVPCRQQKCLVHLIRDINDDLWKAPFDGEFEALALAVRDLLVPILGATDRYGLKAWHLRKFAKDVERFYARHIAGKDYSSELAAKYQKRFERYRDSLFTFLGQDGIPWNNNMAERAIRQLAVQRKISGSFFKRSAVHYLLLLAISQTCRFQGKSFLKFLLSKEKDVDAFRRSSPIRYSAPVGRRAAAGPGPVGEVGQADATEQVGGCQTSGADGEGGPGEKMAPALAGPTPESTPASPAPAGLLPAS
jgi:predicted RecB family nuclease